MSQYRYEVRDLLTGAMLGEVPLGGVTYVDTLNAAGSLQAGLDLGGYTPPVSPGVPVQRRSKGYLQMLLPGRSAICVLRDDVTVGCYILADEPVKALDSQVWLIRAEGLWSYAFERTLNINLTYVGVDQLAIARALVGQAVPQGLPFALPVYTSGVLRDRTYYGYERREIGGLVSQLSELDNGFDFAITADVVANVPVWTFRTYYPRRGRRAIDSGLVFNGGSFTLEKNLRDYAIAPGAYTAATTVYALGAGEGTAMLIQQSVDTTAIDQGYPVREAVIAFKDVSGVANLKSHADAERKYRARQLRTWVLDVNPDDRSVPFGSWQVGDEVRVIIGSDERFPDGADLSLRIIEQAVTVADDGGPDRVLLTMGEPFG